MFESFKRLKQVLDNIESAFCDRFDESGVDARFELRVLGHGVLRNAPDHAPSR